MDGADGAGIDGGAGSAGGPEVVGAGTAGARIGVGADDVPGAGITAGGETGAGAAGAAVGSGFITGTATG